MARGYTRWDAIKDGVLKGSIVTVCVLGMLLSHLFQQMSWKKYYQAEAETETETTNVEVVESETIEEETFETTVA